MPDVETTRRFFDAIAPRYDRVFARPSHELRARMAKLLELIGEPSDVLDLGVGTGTELHHFLDAGHRVTGVDISEEMLALCNQRARKIPCIRANFWEKLPFEAASFDAVIALFGSLAHPPSDDAVADLGREIGRVLRGGGSFYAELPSVMWATAHPTFEDEKTGAGIDVVAMAPDAWRRALAPLEVNVTEGPDEIAIVARKRA